MTDGPLHPLLHELRRRKVLRVALGYAVAGWVVVEVAATILPLLRLPDWTATLVLALVALGFPIALVLAWAFEVTPEGVKREMRQDAEPVSSGGARPDAEAGVLPAAAPGVIPAPFTRARSAGLLGLGILVAVGGLGIGSWWTGRGEAPPSGPTTPVGDAGTAASPSIAVLPFVNMSGDESNEYFSDGITEEILNALANVEGLRVAARTSSFAWKGRTGDMTELGRELRVGTLLEGSVRRADGRVRITAQLIDVESGFHLWSEVYDRELADVFAVQDEIARAIADKLEVRLMGRPATARAPQDPRAWVLYLQGRHLARSWLDSASVREAIERFDSAIAIDPGYALAWAGKADAYVFLAERVQPADVLPAAKAAALRALELDSTLVETHLALADVLLRWDWDWKGAERELRRALELDPTSVEAHRAMASFLFYSRRDEEAKREARLALELARAEALDPAAFRLEEHRTLARIAETTEESIRHYRRILELSPGSHFDRWSLAVRLLESGEAGEAVDLLERIREEQGDVYPMISHLGYAYARSGRREAAEAILADLLDHARDHYVGKDQIAHLYFLLGDEDEARRWMERAFDDRHWWLPALNQSGGWFDDLRDRPWFIDLLRGMNAPGV